MIRIRHIDELKGRAKEGLRITRIVPPEELAKIESQNRSTRITPEAYTRLMLRAKEGDIAPTRIEQVLGKLGSRPIRKLRGDNQ